MGKSHKKEDLPKSIEYQYNVMTFSGYDEENTSLTDRALWWKNYQDHALDEIRQLRARINAGMKNSVIKDTSNKLFIYFVVLSH